MTKIHKEQFEILTYHIDRNGFASMKSISNLIQATVAKHGRVLGSNIEDLSKENLTWAFSRYHIKVMKYPQCFDLVNFSTWRSGSSGPFAYREIEGSDENNNTICAATASAVLIDLDTRKPVDVPEFIKKQFAPEYGRAIDDNFDKLPVPENPDTAKEFHVRLSDIDVNNHVNNSSYIDWIIESVPKNILMNHTITDIEINYRAELFYGETIISHSSPGNDDHTFYHKLVRKEDGKTVSIARTNWINQSTILTQ